MANITMSSSPQSAYLEIILGSMYSGKTSRLVEIYKQCKFCSISTPSGNFFNITHDVGNIISNVMYVCKILTEFKYFDVLDTN